MCSRLKIFAGINDTLNKTRQNEQGIDKARLTRARIKEELAELLEDLTAEEKAADLKNENLNLLNDLGLDSIGILRLVLGIERSFGIKIANDELDRRLLSRLENVVVLVESKINASD